MFVIFVSNLPLYSLEKMKFKYLKQLPEDARAKILVSFQRLQDHPLILEMIEKVLIEEKEKGL
jgi:hypothetical protein